MYSRIFSCGLKVLEHSVGNGVLFALVTPLTWKSLKMAWPHCVASPTGVLNVKCSTKGSFFCGSVPSIQSMDPFATALAS